MTSEFPKGSRIWFLSLLKCGTFWQKGVKFSSHDWNYCNIGLQRWIDFWSKVKIEFLFWINVSPSHQQLGIILGNHVFQNWKSSKLSITPKVCWIFMQKIWSQKLKFGLSEKHTKFEEIFFMVLTNHLIYLVNVKTVR